MLCAMFKNVVVRTCIVMCCTLLYNIYNDDPLCVVRALFSIGATGKKWNATQLYALMQCRYGTVRYATGCSMREGY